MITVKCFWKPYKFQRVLFQVNKHKCKCMKFYDETKPLYINGLCLGLDLEPLCYKQAILASTWLKL